MLFIRQRASGDHGEDGSPSLPRPPSRRSCRPKSAGCDASQGHARVLVTYLHSRRWLKAVEIARSIRGMSLSTLTVGHFVFGAAYGASRPTKVVWLRAWWRYFHALSRAWLLSEDCAGESQRHADCEQQARPIAFCPPQSASPRSAGVRHENVLALPLAPLRPTRPAPSASLSRAAPSPQAAASSSACCTPGHLLIARETIVIGAALWCSRR
jgi:hypothetical protein